MAWVRARLRARVLLQELVLKLVRVWARLLVRVLELVLKLARMRAWDPEYLHLLFLDHELESLLVMQRVPGPPWKHLQVS